jgi:hypothetical protein
MVAKAPRRDERAGIEAPLDLRLEDRAGNQEQSGPLMKGLHAWMEAQLAEHQDGTEFRAGQSHLLLIESLAESDAFPASSWFDNRKQHRRASQLATMNQTHEQIANSGAV